MKTFKIVIELDNFQSSIIEIEAENWAALCEEVFGKIQIIDTELE